MDLREQYEAEARALGGRHPAATLEAFARGALRAPWKFGKSRAYEAADAARDLLRELIGPPPSRWRPTGATSPSGKTIFRCSGCGLESPLPIAACRKGCADEYDDA